MAVNLSQIRKLLTPGSFQLEYEMVMGQIYGAPDYRQQQNNMRANMAAIDQQAALQAQQNWAQIAQQAQAAQMQNVQHAQNALGNNNLNHAIFGANQTWTPGTFTVQANANYVNPYLLEPEPQYLLRLGTADNDINQNYVARERYGFQWHDPRGVFGATQEANTPKPISQEAEKRALELLNRFLTDYQRGQFDAAGWFETTGKSGKTYRIHKATWPSKNVVWMRDGKRCISYCAHPMIDGVGCMAMGDVLLSQKLALETDDEAFTKIACHTVH